MFNKTVLQVAFARAKAAAAEIIEIKVAKQRQS